MFQIQKHVPDSELKRLSKCGTKQTSIFLDSGTQFPKLKIRFKDKEHRFSISGQLMLLFIYLFICSFIYLFMHKAGFFFDVAFLIISIYIAGTKKNYLISILVVS